MEKYLKNGKLKNPNNLNYRLCTGERANMRNFKFLTKQYEGKVVRPQDIRKFGLDITKLDFVAKNFEELRLYPPNMVIAECVKTRKFSQDKGALQQLKKKVKYGMGLGIFQQLWWDPTFQCKILKPSSIKFSNMYKPYTGQDLNNKTLLVIRTGGIGDLLFIQPNLIHLKEQYPSCKIIFGCGPQYQSMVDNWDCVDEIGDLPISFSKIVKADYHAIFEGVIERCSLAHHTNAYRLFTDWLGLCLPDEKLLPRQTPKPERLKIAHDTLDSWGVSPGSFALLLLRASSPIRTPRPEFWKLLINELTSRGHNVVITDAPFLADQIDDFIDTCSNKNMIFNFARYSELLDYSIAMTSLAKGCIATDTSLMHIAASMDIPAFGIYGPFPGEIRLTTYPKSKWINSQFPCAPCFLHGPRPCKNATDGHSKCYDFVDIITCVDGYEELVND